MKQVKNISGSVSTNWRTPRIILLGYMFFMLIILLFYFYITVSPNVFGDNLKELAESRTTVTKELIAARGNIYDSNGNTLATSVTSYTLIAYMREDRGDYVENIEETAKKLSEQLDAPYEYIYERLKKGIDENKYQVEFGSYGSKLTELDKIGIEELELPGLDFVESTKRFYPSGQFASYIIGYAKGYTQINLKLKEEFDFKKFYKEYYKKYPGAKLKINNENIVVDNGDTIKAIKVGSTFYSLLTVDNKIIVNGVLNVNNENVSSRTDNIIKGELGIESKFNDELKGTDGSLTYQKNPNGVKIPDTRETRIEAIDGKDIYLTIDSSIQRFLESAVKEETEKWKSEWMIMVVMDAKTGEILGSATSPNFDPNNLSSTMSYQNPLVSYTFEPGSVMKIYTYLCANETGKYDGDTLYNSGSIKLGDYKVKDWNTHGWGRISYDVGFTYSSNVGAINVAKEYLSPSKLKACLQKYGFGQKTDIELSGELDGYTDYNEQVETDWLSVSFGQGLTTTPIQQIQALSIIANNGNMVKPHIIKKIVDPVTKKETITKTTIIENIASKKSIDKIKKLMYDNVQNKGATGYYYYIKDFDVIGKTGTAQIYEKGRYLTGRNNYIISFAGMFPYDDPQYIIYTAIKKPKDYTHPAIAPYVTNVIKNIAKYKNMFTDVEKNSNINKYIMKNYVSSNIELGLKDLKDKRINTIVIGDGNKIINQYPQADSNILSTDKVFLITNGNNIIMPNMKNWSRSDVIIYANFANLDYEINGNGYVDSQSIKVNNKIGDTKLIIELKDREKKEDR